MSIFFFFKQKTAYELRISDWSSDVCSSDLRNLRVLRIVLSITCRQAGDAGQAFGKIHRQCVIAEAITADDVDRGRHLEARLRKPCGGDDNRVSLRSEEHTSELQSLMRISYAVFCLKKKKINSHCTNNP